MSVRHIVYLLVAIAGVTAASVLLVQSFDKDRSEIPSTYSSHPKGCKALYLLLAELQLPMARFGKSFQRLGNTEGALLVIDPHAKAFESDEVTKLEEWVKKGNRLIIFQGPSAGSSVKSGKYKEAELGAKKWRRAWRSSPAYRFGLRLKSVRADDRSFCKVSSKRLEQIEELSVSDAARWETPPKEWDTLVADDAGPLVVAKRLGQGEIVAISDPTLAQNKYLAEGDNARLSVALLLHDKRPRKVLVDEYHHGHVTAGSFWSFTASSVFAWILLQTALGLMLIIYSRRAEQAGRFRSLSAPKGRSSVEYVASMANVFASSKAASPALEMILRRFLAQVSRKTGVPLKNARTDNMDDRLMQALGASKAAEVVQQCRRTIQLEAEPSAALRLAKELQSIRERILGKSRLPGKSSTSSIRGPSESTSS